MIELCPGWHGSQKEGHAIMIERRAPLSHRRVDSVENMVGVMCLAVSSLRLSNRTEESEWERDQECFELHVDSIEGV